MYLKFVDVHQMRWKGNMMIQRDEYFFFKLIYILEYKGIHKESEKYILPDAYHVTPLERFIGEVLSKESLNVKCNRYMYDSIYNH